MSLRLSRVELEADWTAWLASLDNWRRRADGTWLGRGAILLDGRPRGAMQIDIEICEPVVSKRISVRGSLIQVTDIRCVSDPAAQKSAFNLNHVAIDFATADAGLVRQLKTAEIGTFLRRELRYDPTVGAAVETEHLVSGQTLYLTARFPSALKPPLEISHVGWQVSDIATVERAAALLRSLDWPIVFGPDVVDGSLLVHFRGPDDRVHDVFHVMGDQLDD